MEPKFIADIFIFLLSIQTLLVSMVDTAESLCPHVMRRSNLRTELMKTSSAKMVVPKNFVSKTLLEQSGVDIINKIRCVLHYTQVLNMRFPKTTWIAQFFLGVILIHHPQSFDHRFFLSVSEVKLSLASFLSDRIVDEILEALSTSQHALVSFYFILSHQGYSYCGLWATCHPPSGPAHGLARNTEKQRRPISIFPKLFCSVCY